MTEIDIDKNRLRKLFLSQRRALSRHEVAYKSSVVAANITAHDAFCRAKTIMCYAAMRDEVCIENIMQQALAAKKQVCIPYIHDSAGQMDAALISGMEQLVKGPFGILTVDEASPAFVSAEAIDLILVPGVAFDRDGVRLGMGSGFYDRFLPRALKATVVGIAFACQISESVPCMPYDCLMNYVVTEEEIIDCKTGKM